MVSVIANIAKVAKGAKGDGSIWPLFRKGSQIEPSPLAPFCIFVADEHRKAPV